MQGIYPGSWQVSWKGPKGTGRDGEVPASQGPGDSAWRDEAGYTIYVTYVSELGDLNTDTAMLGQGAGEAESVAGSQQMPSTPTREETSA